MIEFTYHDSSVVVDLGDIVEYRGGLFWLRWKRGVVTYVPGKSEFHPQMEHSGMVWLGVGGVDGTFTGIYRTRN